MALRTPLFDWHVRQSATMVDFSGWDMPVRYDSISEEHHAVRRSAGVFDVSHMARLVFKGGDTLAFLQTVWTNNAASMKEGQVRYGLLCNSQGGIRDDVLVYRWADHWGMVVNAGNRSKILQWFEQQLPGRNVQLIDQTESTVMLAVQGPKAIELCRDLVDGDIQALRYYHGTEATYRGTRCQVSRTGYTGEDGLEITVPADLGVVLADELLQRGVKPCGLGARDTLRLEAAMPLYGHELSEDIDPFQAGLSWAVKFDKGDFIGRDALLARKADTGRPVRVGLEIDGRRAARESAQVLSGDRTVGQVTSGTLTPTLGKPIAMAYIHPDFSSPGTDLLVQVGKSLIAARVVEMPFYRRAG